MPLLVVVKEILDEIVKLDANHPLTGETLAFDIEIIETGLEPDQSRFESGCDTWGESRV